MRRERIGGNITGFPQATLEQTSAVGSGVWGQRLIQVSLESASGRLRPYVFDEDAGYWRAMPLLPAGLRGIGFDKDTSPVFTLGIRLVVSAVYVATSTAVLLYFDEDSQTWVEFPRPPDV